VAKILVADDNSNVQKTVALALADLGVEVVAVNNGDAAVRKLADVNPDLVLADIFMPVRNGYEVCDYVKKDSRFAHVPVVLLVGAFDPLDEREAQRVAADGILKKPFVPPDPLIAMVKTLLDRSLGDRMATVGAPQPAAVAQAGSNAKASGGAGAVKVAERPAAPPAAPAAEPSQEAAEEEFQPPVDRLSFGEGDHPIAFGQLLDTPAQDAAAAEPEAIEPVDDEQVLTSARDANLGEPAFWSQEESEAQSEEGESTSEESEEEDGPRISSPRSWGLGEAALRDHDESGGAPTGMIEPAQPADPDEPIQPIEPFELVRDQADNETEAPTVVEKSPLMVQDAAAQASLTVESG
jgi:CheY-like chemotaxis protein